MKIIEFTDSELLVHTTFGVRKLKYNQIIGVNFLKYEGNIFPDIPPALMPFGFTNYLKFLSNAQKLLIVFNPENSGRIMHFVVHVPLNGTIKQEILSELTDRLTSKFDITEKDYFVATKSLGVRHNWLLSTVGVVFILLVSILIWGGWWLFIYLKDNPEELRSVFDFLT